MDQLYLILLRVFHVVLGAFWAGSAIYVAVFIFPAVGKLGPDGGKFMRQLVSTNKLPVVLLVVPIVTILTGILLIWRLSAGFDEAWTSSLHGKVLMAAALAALTAFCFGQFVNRPAADKLRRLSQEIAKSGAPPTPEQTGEMGKLAGKLGFGTRVIAWLVLFALIGMSMAHYL